MLVVDGFAGGFILKSPWSHEAASLLAKVFLLRLKVARAGLLLHGAVQTCYASAPRIALKPL